MTTREYTQNEKEYKIRKKQYIIPCGHNKFIRHWTIQDWVRYVDNYGQWL